MQKLLTCENHNIDNKANKEQEKSYVYMYKITSERKWVMKLK
jgi:hypothetical protein